MDKFLVVTTLIALGLATLSIFVPWRLWVLDRSKGAREKPDANLVEISYEGDASSSEIILCVPRRTEETVFVAPLHFIVANKNPEPIRDVILNFTIPELLYRSWADEPKITGPATIFDLKQYSELIDGRKVVQATMRVPFINPNTAINIGIEVFLEGATEIQSSTPARTKDGVDLIAEWQLIYSFVVDVTASCSIGAAPSLHINLHVFCFDPKSDLSLERQVVASSIFQAILKNYRSKPIDLATHRAVAAIVEFKAAELLPKPKGAEELPQVERLSQSELRLLQPTYRRTRR